MLYPPVIPTVSFIAAAPLAVAAAPSSPAVDQPRYAFDLPRDDAQRTLQRFADETGRELVYLVDSVRGVVTNEVQGQLTAREALEELLRGTALTAIEDKQTGALLVRRAEAAGREPGQSRTRRAGPLRLLAAWFALVVAPAPIAQAADGTPLTGSIQGRVENVSTGNYLSNVQVVVEGTGLTTLTDTFGEFRLGAVPVGPRVIRVEISGYGAKTAEVTVGSEPATANFQLAPVNSARTDANQTVVLEAFVVESQRTMSGSSLAVAERRNAMNLKNVVAADEFGDSAEGNVAEFVKHLPGLTIDYNNADPRYVSVRGLPSFGTAVMVDGNRLASAADNFSRGTEFNQVSLNNMAFIEVAKSPLPDTPADTIGGSINMVLKSAFERSRPLFTYRVSLNTNLSRAGDINLVRANDIPGPRGKVSTVKPGFDLTYVNPVSDRFGYTFSLLNSNQYSPSAFRSAQWRPVASGTSLSTADQPFLGTVLVSDRPREGFRWSSGLTFDWRLGKYDVLSLGTQWNRFETVLDLTDLQFNPVDSAVRPTVIAPDTTAGATGAGRASWALTTFHKFMLGHNVSLSHRHRGPVWNAASGLAYSFSKTYVDSEEDGVIKTINLRSPALAIRYDGISDSLPARISATSAGGATFNFADLDGYTIQSMTQDTPQNYRSRTFSAYANASRRFDASLPIQVKSGFDVRREERDTTNPTTTLSFVGPDRVAGTADDRAGLYDLVADDYSRLSLPYGIGVVERPSSAKAFQLLQSNPQYFVVDEAAYIRTAATNSKEFSETVAAGFVRLDLALLQNRLKLAGGFRYEHTYNDGRGLLNDPTAIYQKTPDGSLVLDGAGRPIRLPGTAAELARLQYQERGSKGERDYGDLFPSVSATYSIGESLLVRGSFAQTITRPQINSVVPSTTVTEPGASGIATITVNNPGLKPWFSNSYDVAIEYYFDRPGLISVGAFLKDITDFFGSVRREATPELLAEYGFDDSFLGYDIVTQTNVGSARVSGVELDYRQSLPDSGWMKGLALFANGTALHVEGESTANFSGFISRSANWGVSLSRPRFTGKLNWNYRGRQRLSAVTGTNVPPDTYQYASPRLSLDLNVEVRITKNSTFFANVRNLTDIGWRNETYGPSTLEYARTTSYVEYGPQLLFGVKGQF